MAVQRALAEYGYGEETSGVVVALRAAWWGLWPVPASMRKTLISIRRAFVAPAGYQLVSADYSQIELRILAHMTGEPALVRQRHASGSHACQ